jgi:diguanylate cyclase (GGDEF)-like protein
MRFRNSRFERLTHKAPGLAGGYLLWGDATLLPDLARLESAGLHSAYFAVAAVLALTLLQQQLLRTYLETPEQYVPLDGLLKRSMPVAMLALVAAPFIPAMQLLMVTVAAYLAIQMADLALSLYVAAGGSKAARIYSAALLFTAALWTCGLLLPESDGFTRLLLMHLFAKLGFVTQIIILTLGMGLRIYSIRQDSHRRFEIISRENEDLSKQNLRLQKASHTDGLTQVGNRAYFESSFNMEWSRALREKSHLTLLLIDVDDFKEVNDTRGHPFGDQCLVGVALAIRGCLHRGSDRVMRYGGEEFAALLVGTDVDGVPIVAERIRLAVKSLEFDDCAVTVSVGGAAIVPRAEQKSSDFIELVDGALYAAKAQGRDSVVVRSSESSDMTASDERSA